MPVGVELQKGGGVADVGDGGDGLTPVNAIARGAYDLGHIRPHTVPTLTTKLAAIARTLDRDAAIERFDTDCIDTVESEIRVAKFLARRIRLDCDVIGVLSGAAQTTDTFFRARRKTANGTRKYAVHARAAEHDFTPLTQPKVEYLLDDILCQANPADHDVEAAGPLIYVGGGFGGDVIAVVRFFFCHLFTFL